MSNVQNTIYILKKPAHGEWEWKAQEIRTGIEGALKVAESLAASGYRVKILTEQMEVVQIKRIVQTNENNREGAGVG